jgi:UDP-GlcNAc:undecaprenyl-phosphate/decaprenyl-phosphate GlcNAc-1-phosphate transferase
MLALAIAFLSSLVITLLIIRYQHLHAHVTADHDLDGVQKFHAIPVPRVGGLGVYLGILAGLLAKWWVEDPVAPPNLGLLACGLPAFGAGLVEDLTKRVGVRERLMATAFSALLGGYFLGAWLTRLDISGFDSLLHSPTLSVGSNAIGVSGLLSIIVTAFAVAGVANAFNIIDGYNGLAGVVAIISLLGLAYVADQVGDRLVLVGALALIGAIAGFLVWNYPNGLIFLGDGGAYLIGFLVAEFSVLLVARNEQVSPWFPLLLSFYPIFETIFTVFRRVVIGRTHPGLPDAAHLHQLIYRRLVRWAVGSECSKRKNQRNALTSPYLWVMSSFAVIPATVFWKNSGTLQLFVILFALVYVLIYRKIYLSRFPKWLSIRKKRM